MLSYNGAEEICKTLFNAGFTAYFAGGWVRDKLLGNPSDDIDIATSAPPHIIQQLFSKTIPVGIAFGVVIVVKEGLQFEVSTFRKDLPYVDGRHPEGIDFSTAEKDAQRRDFTVNGMFYDPLTQTVIDFVGGKEDLNRKIIRAIGNPHERFQEDRLRMIRAVRFASRLGFHLEENTASAIKAFAHDLLPSVSMERIWQELCKMAKYHHFDQSLISLHQLGLLHVIFPELQHISSATLSERVSLFAHFPIETPTIAYLLELFPEMSLEDRLNLCNFLKTSSEEKKLVEFFAKAETLLKSSHIDLYDWAYFYAHPLASLFVGIAAAKKKGKERLIFAKEHVEREHSLSQHIHRIQRKTPLVTSEHLKQLGIKPGIQMGHLLKRAEQISINDDLHDLDAVLKKLKNEIPDSS